MFRFSCCSVAMLALSQFAVAGEVFEPSLADPKLVGMYRIISAEGPEAGANWRGFAAITRACGLISNHDGTAPLPFTLRTAKEGQQNLIDLELVGDTDDNTLYGIYEITGDTLRICVASSDVIAMHGRPRSVNSADVRHVTKLILKRISEDEPTKKPDSSTEMDAHSDKTPMGQQSLIEIQPHSSNPFAINSSAVEVLLQAEDQSARSRLVKIKQDMADLVTRHPATPAAKEITTILDKAGLKVIPGHGVYPKHVFCFTIPITR